ncbi:MAG: Trk family potassium uptake protein [Clostridia bacterium]|nr:Trk family potassium uptake protein [Clostridia bacterium]
MTTFRIIACGFVALILTGTLLLSLPFASRKAGSAEWLDCLFTATSAVCVTGLVVQDTASFWTPFGQAVILALIQIGGMGVVTAAVSLAFLSGRKIGLMQRGVMQESISAPQLGGIVRLTRFIVLTSLGIEAAGALLLLPSMITRFGAGSGIWHAVFHAVSAFCNAGFDLMGSQEPFSSLTGFSQNILVNITVMLLITVGGIGFLVWNDVKEHGFHWKQYRMQTKTVLLTSACLILLPALWFFLFEAEQFPTEERILPALFQSVTLRTAGFNTMDLNRLSDSGQALMIVCMLVGGSPGSTAGGMKTTTVAVLLTAAFAVFRRKDHATLWGRRIAEDTVRQAVAILMMYLLLFFCSGMIISRIEGLSLISCLFETASAIGTVGLTLGITPSLSVPSRLILITLMFLGRVGGLTLIYAAQSVKKGSQSTLPLEKITVG